MLLLTAVGVGAIVLRGQVDGARLQATLLPLIYPGVFSYCCLTSRSRARACR